MQLLIAEEHVRVLTDQLTAEEARAVAEQEKLSVFGNISKFFFRPRAQDVEIVTSEKRYEPFWYLSARSDYQFDRRGSYGVTVPSKEVASVTIRDSDLTYDIGAAHAFTLHVTEHCHVERVKQMTVDALTGEPRSYDTYLTLPSEEIEDLATFAPEEALVVPPQVRASFVVRDLLSQMMKEAMPAEVVHKDHVEITEIVLYLHPLHAFQYRWAAKDKETIAEVDGLTGELKLSTRALGQQIGRVISTDLLFDVGVDAVDLLVPGGGIALKVGRALVDYQRRHP